MQSSRTSRLITCLLLLHLLFAGCSKQSDDSVPAGSKVSKSPAITGAVATVNGVAIPTEDLDKELTRIQQRFYTSANMSKDQKNKVKKEILNILINSELFYQAAQKLNISSTQEEIEADLKKTLEQYPNTANFTNTFTPVDIKKKLAVEKFISQTFSDPTIISDEQTNKYYLDNIDDFTRSEQAFASHILITVDDQTVASQKEKAFEKISQIQAQLKAGKAFAELADQFSEDPKKMTGGHLGYVVRGQLDPDLESAVFALEPDQVSDIVQSRYGYHLISISEKKPRYVYPLAEISDKLKAFLKQKEVQKTIDNFITTQREEAQITTYL